MRYLQTGLLLNDPVRAQTGYTLFTPMYGKKSYLVDMGGRVAHEWTLPGEVGSYAHLLPGGRLFATIHTKAGPEHLAGKGGRFVELDKSGNVVWEYHDDFQHHDFRRLANGNTIYIAWERLTPELTATIKGGKAGTDYPEGIWGDCLREVDASGKLVWEWHARDHFDFTKYPLKPDVARHEYAHPNALHPMANGNILVSLRQIDTIIVIDRKSGTIAWERHEPAWGGQHDAQELANGNILLFANRLNLGPLRGSAIVEFDPKTNETVWEYMAQPMHTFDSHFISGAQRLANGNTLICEGLWGRIFEVTKAGAVVWEYVNPHFTPEAEGVRRPNVNYVFRALRYEAHAPHLQGLI